MTCKHGAVAIVMLLLVGAVAATAQPMVGLRTPWNVIGSGGAIGASGTNIQMSSTIGQPSIGPMKNAAIGLHLGFWYPVGKTSQVKTQPERGATTVELRQNYPNPFRTQTTIGFSLPSRSRVRLTVYNMVGEQVTVLADAEMEPGYREVVWNGMSQAQQPVSSGDYICEMEVVPQDGGAVTGTEHAVRKRQIMHLLK
jgi:hypothetical protein